MRNPRGVTIDAKNRAVLVSDKDLNAVLTFEVPQLFSAPTEEASPVKDARSCESGVPL